MNSNNYPEQWFNEHLMIFEESPTFKCARRLWLLSYHFNLPLPEYVMKKFVEGIEKQDSEWKTPKSKWADTILIAQFVGDHMEEQKQQTGKASKAAAIDAYVKKMITEYDEEIDPKTIEKKLERWKKFINSIGDT